MVLTILGPVVLIGAFWLLVLGPKRQEAATIDRDIAAARATIADGRSQIAAARAGRDALRRNVAQLRGIGRAVPAGEGVPALLRELERTARREHVDMQAIGTQRVAPPAAPAPAPESGSGSGSGSAPGSASASASGPTTSPAANGVAAKVTKTAAGANAAAGADAGTGGTPAAGGAAPGGGLPPGVSTVKLTMTFKGSFSHLERFFSRIDRFIKLSSKRIQATGRLLSLSTLQLGMGEKGFPQLSAEVGASIYVLPDPTTLAAPSGSAPATPAAPGTGPGTAATRAPQTVSATGGTP